MRDSFSHTHDVASTRLAFAVWRYWLLTSVEMVWRLPMTVAFGVLAYCVRRLGLPRGTTEAEAGFAARRLGVDGVFMYKFTILSCSSTKRLLLDCLMLRPRRRVL